MAEWTISAGLKFFKERKKFGEDKLDKLCKWFIEDCELIIHNPIKGDSVYLRDKNSESW